MKHKITICNDYDLQLNCIINKFQMHLASHYLQTKHPKRATITFACSDQIKQTLNNHCFMEFFMYKDSKIIHCLQDVRGALPIFSCEIDCCLESFITNKTSDIIRRTFTSYHEFEKYKAIHLT
jgi:hypothetical protein